MPAHTLTTVLVIGAAAALAPLLADLTGKARIPSVVIELLLGIAIGPHVLGWATIDDVVQTFAQLGLAMLIFLAGFEVDIARIRGRPLNLAVSGWLLSLAIGVTVGAIAVDTGFAVSGIAVGLCLTSTTLGTLLPMLRDRGELETRFGVFVLAAGALALRPRPPRIATVLSSTLNTTGQFAVRLCMLVNIALVWVADELGLDVLLGAFAAGMVIRLFLASGDVVEREVVRCSRSLSTARPRCR